MDLSRRGLLQAAAAAGVAVALGKLPWSLEEPAPALPEPEPVDYEFVANADRLSVPAGLAGYYILGWSGLYTGGGPDDLRSLQVTRRHPGEPPKIISQTIHAPVAGPMHEEGHAVVFLEPGDHVEFSHLVDQASIARLSNGSL